MQIKIFNKIFLAILIGIVSTLLLTTSAFAATSIKYGWIALDSNKNPILQGSKYSLSGEVKPVAYISNGTDITAVNSKAVVYLDNNKVGTAQALIVGKNIVGYQDAFITKFTIVNTPEKTSISSAEITGLESKTYTGGTQTQSNMKVAVNGKTLNSETDYTVAYKDNTEAGTATITITGKGNYTGTKIATFKINAKSISLAKVTSIPKQAYTGKTVKPSVTVKIGSTKLKKDRDYKLTYKNNKNVGTASVTITGMGNYNDKKQVTFAVRPSAKKFVDVAKSELAWWKKTYGSRTGYDIGKKYWSNFTKNSQSWCSEFVGYCLLQSGLKKGTQVPSNAHCAGNFYKFYTSGKGKAYAEVHTRGEKGFQPRAGDIVLQYKEGRWWHTEMVTSFSNGKTSGISGGARVGTTGNRWNNSQYKCYIRIKWDKL